MSKINDYTTGNLLDYLYHQNYYYKLIDIDLSKQTSTSIPQRINFVGKLEDCFAKFLYHWKATKTILNISIHSLKIKE